MLETQLAIAGDRDLTRYLPRIGVERLARGDIDALGPWQHRTEGALLFADIADFVGLTEFLTRDGAKGSEKVTDIIEEFFSDVTDTVFARGGDVVSLAGDSITAFWPADEDLEGALVASAHCAMALHAIARRLARKNRPSIRSRAAISAGELVISGVGGREYRMMTVLSGVAVWEASALFHDAKPGQTLVCPSAVGQLRAHCTLEPAESGGLVLVRVDAEPQLAGIRFNDHRALLERGIAAAYLPEYLTRRVETAPRQRFAEFRRASVVFINLLDVEDALDSLQALVGAIQRKLSIHGGSLEQLTVDEKGLNALGAFGLPAHSHKDDALRALRAGTALDVELRERGLNPNIGISSGLVYCAEVGTPSRAHIALCGQSINFAARLAATGTGLLCDGATAELVGRGFTFSILKELPIAGLEGHFRVFRPEHEALCATERPKRSLTGRTKELYQIILRLDQLELGQGGATIITGESGIGKSRLLYESVAIAEDRNYCVFVATLGDDADTAPFGLWFKLKTNRQVETGDNSAGEVLVFPGTAPDRAAAPSTWAARFKTGIVDLLLERAKAPLVLAIDDLHMANDESLELLGEVLDDVPNCLLLATAILSGSRNAQTILRFCSRHRGDRVHLEGLSREAVAMQAADVLGVREIPTSLRDNLYERTGGHPLYCEELALALRASRRIVTTGGTCRIPESTVLAVDAPPTLQAVVAMRVDNLSGDQQRLIKSASVLGRHFSTQLLRAIFREAEQQAFDRDIGVLEDDDFLASDGPSMRFRHPLMREIIYSLLPDRERRSIHGATFQILSRQPSIDGGGLSVLAHHADQAGRYPEAIAFLEQLVELARNRYANREAIRLQQQAFGLAKQHDVPLEARRRAEWWSKVADAHQELSEHRLADSCYREALRAMEYPPPDTTLRLAVWTAVQLAAQMGWRMFGSAMPRRPSADDGRLTFLAHICQRISEVSFFQNEPLSVLHYTLCAANLAETSRANRQMAVGQASLAIGLGLHGLGRLARYYNALALATAQADGDPATRAYVHLLTTVMAFSQGDWELVETNGNSACQLYREVGDEFRLYQARFIQLFALLLVGDVEQARAIQHEMAAAPSCMTFQQPRFWTITAAMLLDMLTGRSTEFRIQQLQDLNIDNLDLADRMLGHGLLAVALLNQGEWRQALESAEAGLSLLLQNPPTIGGGYVFGAAGPAEVMLRVANDMEVLPSDRNAAKARAGEAIKALRIYAKRVPVAKPRILLLEGRFAELLGNRQRARRLWRDGMRRAEALGMKIDLDLLRRAVSEAVTSDQGEPLELGELDARKSGNPGRKDTGGYKDEAR